MVEGKELFLVQFAIAVLVRDIEQCQLVLLLSRKGQHTIFYSGPLISVLSFGEQDTMFSDQDTMFSEQDHV